MAEDDPGAPVRLLGQRLRELRAYAARRAGAPPDDRHAAAVRLVIAAVERLRREVRDAPGGGRGAPSPASAPPRGRPPPRA